MSIVRGKGGYWLPMDIYPAYVCFVPNEKEWKRLLKHLNVLKQDQTEYVDPHCGRMSALHNSKSNSMCIAVMLHNTVDKDPAQVVASLVHEATHVWQVIKRHINEKSPSDEQEAYFMEFLIRNLMEAFGTAKKRGERKRKA